MGYMHTITTKRIFSSWHLDFSICVVMQELACFFITKYFVSPVDVNPHGVSQTHFRSSD